MLNGLCFAKTGLKLLIFKLIMAAAKGNPASFAGSFTSSIRQLSSYKINQIAPWLIGCGRGFCVYRIPSVLYAVSF